MLSLAEAQFKEQKAFEYYKKTNPAVLNPISFSEKEIFSRIGINVSFSNRYDGYIRFYPQDFIVEEISINKEISKIEPKENILSPPEHFHLYCDLIKIGISTFDALIFLAENLEIKPKRIAYAGLKDDNAITSQRFVFLDCNPALFEKIKKISSNDVFLSNFSIGKKNKRISQRN
jgi:tRNA(Glu) U13 pseudouridine synthase TruD